MPTLSENMEAAEEIYHRLLLAYGHPDWQPCDSPVDELVLTILSQSTNDTNAGRAFAALRGRYPTWQQVVDAPLAELVDTIRAGGLARQKAAHIQAALRHIHAQRGAFDLDFLTRLAPGEALRWLTSMAGIGHKTASIVLLFCFGIPSFPVDTHVARVTRRLGLLGGGAAPEKIKALWESIAPGERFYALHVNLIRHGRQVCRAPQPRCYACVLEPICRYPDKRLAADGPSKARSAAGLDKWGVEV